MLARHAFCISRETRQKQVSEDTLLNLLVICQENEIQRSVFDSA